MGDAEGRGMVEERKRERMESARGGRGREEEEEGAVNSESKEDRDGGERGRI